MGLVWLRVPRTFHNGNHFGFLFGTGLLLGGDPSLSSEHQLWEKCPITVVPVVPVLRSLPPGSTKECAILYPVHSHLNTSETSPTDRSSLVTDSDELSEGHASHVPAHRILLAQAPKKE